MKVPISKRLACCAGMIPPGAQVADIGTDHGYLPIYLLRRGDVRRVIAADLREMPLQNAKKNAERFHLADQITFVLSDGLAAIAPEAADTIVCAGMGGDLIAGILAAAPWTRSPDYTLILQAQSTVHELRRWLADHGYAIVQETLVREGGFLYPVMCVRFAGASPVSPGEHYVSQALLDGGSPLLPDYLRQQRRNLEKTVQGISKAAAASDREKLPYYTAALQQVRQWEETYGDSTGNFT